MYIMNDLKIIKANISITLEFNDGFQITCHKNTNSELIVETNDKKSKDYFDNIEYRIRIEEVLDGISDQIIEKY